MGRGDQSTAKPSPGLLAVRAQCPNCGGMRVPAYRTEAIGEGTWQAYRRCADCGIGFKGMEMSASAARAKGILR